MISVPGYPTVSAASSLQQGKLYGQTFAHATKYKNYQSRNHPFVPQYRTANQSPRPIHTIAQYWTAPIQTLDRQLKSMGTHLDMPYSLLDLTGSLLLGKKVTGHPLEIWDLLKVGVWLYLYMHWGYRVRLPFLGITALLQVVGVVFLLSGWIETRHESM